MKILLLFITLLGLGFWGSNLQANEGNPTSALADEIKATEALRLHYLTTNDLEPLGAMLCETLVYTHSSGHRQNKAQFLESLRSGEMKYLSINHDSINIDIYGGTTAVVTGTTRFHVQSKTAGMHDVHLLYLLVYVKEDGRWKVAAWQSTKLASN
jgi:uncharacterized protein (TIGR02246 family)